MTTKWRLYDTQYEDDGEIYERLIREETEFGLGHEFHFATVDVAWIKRRVTNEAIDNGRYRIGAGSFHKIRIPKGVPMMGYWRTSKKKARLLGCAFYFVKESKDGRYRIELEVNYENTDVHNRSQRISPAVEV